MFKILYLSIWLILHPVHVTFTSIDYDSDTSSFKVFVKMYFDDFMSDCLYNGIIIKQDGFTSKDSSSIELMEKYLLNRLMIYSNNKQLSGKLLDFNRNNDELNINLEFGCRKKPGTITVKNIIMTNLFADQTNMIIIRVQSFEEGLQLSSDITEHTFKIK